MKLYKPTKGWGNTLERLVDDNEYYGEFGKQFLSQSDIKALISNPKTFKEDRADNKAFASGRYFHQAFLEPDKAKVFPTLDVASRNTKAYREWKEENDGEFILLTKEKEETDEMVKAMKMNFEFYDKIYADGNKFEVPGVAMIKGFPFKGKADILCDDCVIDLKTSANIQDFKWTARKYNYDAQAYIYQYIFGKPLKFYVIDKATHVLGRFNPKDSWLRGGEMKVEKALAMYMKYYGDNPTDDVANFIIEEDLD